MGVWRRTSQWRAAPGDTGRESFGKLFKRGLSHGWGLGGQAKKQGGYPKTGLGANLMGAGKDLPGPQAFLQLQMERRNSNEPSSEIVPVKRESGSDSKARHESHVSHVCEC